MKKIVFTFVCMFAFFLLGCSLITSPDSISTSNGKDHKYTKDEIDFFATYWENQCYLIPVECCSTEKTLWFG